MREIAIDLLSVLAILSSMVMIPVMVLAIIAFGVGMFQWICEKMYERSDRLVNYLNERRKDHEDKT